MNLSITHKYCTILTHIVDLIYGLVFITCQPLRKGAGFMNAWIENELKGCEFPDVRLKQRFKTVIEQLATGIGRSLPFACQDWANTKAAYRFLGNRRICEAEILNGHFQATHERFTASSGPVLVLHDTTEFTFRRERTETIGKTHKTAAGPTSTLSGLN